MKRRARGFTLLEATIVGAILVAQVALI